MSDRREDGDALVKDVEFSDFARAMAFVNQVADHDLAAGIDGLGVG